MLLLALGALRVLVVVLHEPLIGYANNGDFARLAAWFDLWPRTSAGVNPTHASPAAPIPLLRVDPTVDAPRDYVTTELAIVGSWLALPAWAHGGAAARRTGSLELRALGLWRALWLGLAGVAVTLALRRVSPAAGLVAAGVFALVLCDPAVTLYLATLYSEFSVALSAFVAVALTMLLVARGPARPLAGTALAAALFALAWAKIQMFLLPLVLAGLVVAAAAAFHRRALRRRVSIAVLCALVASAGAAALLQKRQIDGGGYMAAARMFNVTNAYFGTFLPLLREPLAGVRALGLPDRCAAYVGKSWFDPGMDPPPCPELFDVPRFGGIARLAALEPSFLPRLVAGALPLTRPFVYSGVGHVAGGEHERVPLRGLLASLAASLDGMPLAAYLALWCVAAAGGAVAIVELACAAWRAEPIDGHLLAAFVVVLAAIAAYALASAVGGDGYGDLAKHLFLGQLSLTVLGPAAAAQIARRAASALR